MLTPRGYGNSAYYWVGFQGTNVGAGNLSGQKALAGWFGGLFGGIPGTGSNLGARTVMKYSRRPTVFSPTVGGSFVGILGKQRVAFPESTTWVPWSGAVT